MSIGKPDLENGYFRLSNEFYDALLIYKLNQTQRLVMDALLRKIWGWGKKEDDLSLSQLSVMIGLKEPHISTALNNLAEMNLILKKRGRYGQIVSINKYYRTWKDWDSSCEYWHNDKNQPIHEQKNKKQDQALTNEQIACWEWAKIQDYWKDKVPTEGDFIKLYSRHNSGIKTQYSEFMSKSKQRMSALEEKNTRHKRIKRKSFIRDADSGDFINGECEVVNE